jgi:hypothetical protein
MLSSHPVVASIEALLSAEECDSIVALFQLEQLEVSAQHPTADSTADDLGSRAGARASSSVGSSSLCFQTLEHNTSGDNSEGDYDDKRIFSLLEPAVQAQLVRLGYTSGVSGDENEGGAGGSWRIAEDGSACLHRSRVTGHMRDSLVGSTAILFDRGMSSLVDAVELRLQRLLGDGFEGHFDSDTQIVHYAATTPADVATRSCVGGGGDGVCTETSHSGLTGSTPKMSLANEYGLHYDCTDFAGAVYEKDSKTHVTATGERKPSRQTNDRALTMMIYLTDVPAGQGGLTELPFIGVSVRPQKGKLLLFENLDTQDLCSPLSAFRDGEVVVPEDADVADPTAAGKYVLQKAVFASPLQDIEAEAAPPGHAACAGVSCRWYERAGAGRS